MYAGNFRQVHGFERLQILCDIHGIANGAAGEVDEHWLAVAADRTGGALSLAVGLALAAGVFKDPQCQRLAGRFGRGLRTRVARMLLSPATLTDPPLSKLRRQAFRELLKLGRKLR